MHAQVRTEVPLSQHMCPLQGSERTPGVASKPVPRRHGYLGLEGLDPW